MYSNWAYTNFLETDFRLKFFAVKLKSVNRYLSRATFNLKWGISFLIAVSLVFKGIWKRGCPLLILMLIKITKAL